MIKIVIIEDEPVAQQVLTGLIKEFIPGLEIVGIAGSVKEGIVLVENIKPELIFLDIRLPDGDGFEVLENLTFKGFEVIFTTAYGEFREQAFDHFALNYLTKPIELEKLEKTIERYKLKKLPEYSKDKVNQLKQFIPVKTGKLPLPAKDGYVVTEISEIIRCEGESNYTKVIMKDGTVYTVAKTLKYFEDILLKYSFFRIHKSHLVNTNSIKEIKTDGTVILSNNEKVFVSQRSRKAFIEYLHGGFSDE